MARVLPSLCLLALASAVCLVACDSSFDISEPGDVQLDVTVTMDLWADLMPVQPPGSDPIHAIVRGTFVNLSVGPRVIEVERRRTGWPRRCQMHVAHSE